MLKAVRIVVFAIKWETALEAVWSCDQKSVI
jgi:hypothetical protein